MKLLVIHADFLEWWKTKDTPVAEKADTDHFRDEELLVAFVTIEPGDAGKVDQAAAELETIKDRVKCDKLYLYPYAHLSDKLARPKEAVATLDTLVEKLGCRRAPFGWYKKFHLHAKGHPLAESSRSL
jgi:threonyl-tRNA synthetase